MLLLNSSDFRTKTMYVPANNLMESAEDRNIWVIGIDAGYSSVKFFAPNGYGLFPAYAEKIARERQIMGHGIGKDNIVYRDDKTNELWHVGACAQNYLDENSIKDSDDSLLARDRYVAPAFKVLAEVGLAFSMVSNEYGSPNGKTVYVETGLPPRYMTDEPLLKKVLAGTHEFSVKIGPSGWQSFKFEIKPEHVFAMEQPKGAIFSAATQKNGKFHPDAGSYMRENTLILDPGFKTNDDFEIRNGMVASTETLELGMSEILRRTAKDIQEQYNLTIPIMAMQHILEKGTIAKFDMDTMSSEEVAISDILAKNCKQVCEEVIAACKNKHSYLRNIKYLIMDGGLGEVWGPMFEEQFKNMKTLHILYANQNVPEIPLMLSNVRGYYYACLLGLISQGIR